jgi:3',5'-cyclic AMP phosphodiesterase CpdA
MSSPQPIRLAHLSDVHVTVRPLGWHAHDWLSKRVSGWLNLRVLGRAYRFRYADTVLSILRDELRATRPDHVVFSGDASTLGFPSELTRAATLLGAIGPDALPGLAVPGNHDHYTRTLADSGLFEKTFANWLQGQRIDEETYPFAQRVGPAWLIGVNSSTGNRWPWDASGSVGSRQLERLEQLLASLGPGPRILVTHYPYCLAEGSPERRSHRLRDRADLMDVAVRGKISLWLHGHRHDPYVVTDANLAPLPILCGGSSTQCGYWSYGLYTLTGSTLNVQRRGFMPQEQCFRPLETFDLQLPNGV